MNEKNYNIQCLRAIGMILVFASHLGQFVNSISWWGSFGVSLFFVLSGYLIGTKPAGEIVKKNYAILFIDGLKYAFKKAKKIAPIYYVMLLGSIPYTLYSKKAYSLTEIIDCGLLSKFAANVLFVQSWIPDSHYAISFNWPCWFLSSLMMLYIFTPILLKIVNKVSATNALAVCIAIWIVRMAISYMFIDCTFEAYDKYYYWLYVSPASRVSDFTCGMFFARYLVSSKDADNKKVVILEIIGIVLFLLYAFMQSVNLIPAPYGYGQLFIPISIIWIYVFLNGSKGKITPYFINETTKYLGDISSDFYIIHRMALCYFAVLIKDHLIAGIFGAPELASAVNVFLVTIAFISIIVACIVWKKIQEKVRQIFK